jgi:hypothetical protein
VSRCVPLRCLLRYKGDLDQNPSHFLCYHFFSSSSRSPHYAHFTNQHSSNPLCLSLSPPAMDASHPHLFQRSVADENEIHKLVKNHFLPDQAVLQWRRAVGEDIVTPNAKKIVVFFFFFQHGFGLPAATSCVASLMITKLS